ncbi:MAG TPA: GNAT family N-acetyltransferase [Telluria sp.]|nr:GNAT family N-acetyltransferase [Telluria sp.]
MNLELRRATEADVPFLLELRRETMDAHLAASGAPTTDAYHLERLMYRFECAEVLLADGLPSGLLKVDRSAPCWEIVQIQLSQRLQGRGIGRVLLEQVLAEADGCGADVSLSVLKANPARGLYERLGFALISEDRIEFHMFRPARPR